MKEFQSEQLILQKKNKIRNLSWLFYSFEVELVNSNTAVILRDQTEDFAVSWSGLENLDENKMPLKVN